MLLLVEFDVFTETHCFIGNVGIICVLWYASPTFQVFINFLPFSDIFCAADTWLCVCIWTPLPGGAGWDWPVGDTGRLKAASGVPTFSYLCTRSLGAVLSFVLSWQVSYQVDPPWFLYGSYILLGSNTVFSLCLSTWRNQVSVAHCCLIIQCLTSVVCSLNLVHPTDLNHLWGILCSDASLTDT